MRLASATGYLLVRQAFLVTASKQANGDSDMSKPIDENIRLTKLQMDPENPRHDELDSQQAIIEWMTSGKGKIGDKVFVLAKDICEHGINYADRLIVVKNASDASMYVALEGNRRLTALKLLVNPNAAPADWRDRYNAIAKQAKGRVPAEIPCVVYSDKESAYHFVELKHLGQSGGAGTVEWGAIEKARQERRRRGKSRSDRSIALLEHVKSSDLYSEEVQAAADSMRITTLDRLLSSANFRAFLGIQDIDGVGLGYAIDPTEAAKAIAKVVLDFGLGEKKVGAVINETERKQYQLEFKEEHLPDYSKRLDKPIGVNSKEVTGLVSKEKDKSRASFQYENPRTRRFLPFRGQVFAIDGKRYARPRYVFEELKGIQVQESKDKRRACFPNAAAVLFRSFLEMTVMAYIDTEKKVSPNPAGWREVKLNERIKVVLDELVSAGEIDKKKAGPITKALADRNNAAHTDILNNYVHNYDQPVHARDLLHTWEVYSPLLQGIWTNLHKK